LGCEVEKFTIKLKYLQSDSYDAQKCARIEIDLAVKEGVELTKDD
jgi:hypothetical protein